VFPFETLLCNFPSCFIRPVHQASELLNLYSVHRPRSVAGDIARISGYVVSYATKGNKSYQSECDSIAALIENAGTDFAGDQKGEVVRLSRKIMNMFITSRVVSKAEASVELLSLDLYWCTESMRHVNLSSFHRLKEQDESGSDNVAVYANRKERANVSMNDFLNTLSAKKGSSCR